jgi:hypothetical protein
MRLFLVLLSLFLAAPAEAEAPLPAAFCQKLVKHVPSADVAYQPGIDVYGKPVVPADLTPPPAIVPDKIAIPLSLDLMKAAGLNASAYPFSLLQRNDIALGTLVLEGDKVTLNGHPLADEEQDKLAVLCLTAHE